MNILKLIITLPIMISIIIMSGNHPQIYSEKDDDDKDLSEYDVESLCGASEDYEAHKEQCDKIYDMLDEGKIKDDPDYEYD